MTHQRRVSKLCHRILLRNDDDDGIGLYDLVDQVLEECATIPQDEDFDLTTGEVWEICLREYERFYEREVDEGFGSIISSGEKSEHINDSLPYSTFNLK